MAYAKYSDSQFHGWPNDTMAEIMRQARQEADNLRSRGFKVKIIKHKQKSPFHHGPWATVRHWIDNPGKRATRRKRNPVRVAASMAGNSTGKIPAKWVRVTRSKGGVRVDIGR